MNALILPYFCALLGSTIVFALPAPSGATTKPAAAQPATKPIRIRITDGTQVLTATLEDSAPAADFASMFPLTPVMVD